MAPLFIAPVMWVGLGVAMIAGGHRIEGVTLIGFMVAWTWIMLQREWGEGGDPA